MIQAWEQHMQRHRGTGQDPKPGWLSPFSPRGSSQSEPGKLGELWNSLPSAQKKDKPAQPVLPVAAGSFSCRRGTGCADGGYPPPGRVCIGQKTAGWHTGQGCEGGMLAAGGLIPGAYALNSRSWSRAPFAPLQEPGWAPFKVGCSVPLLQDKGVEDATRWHAVLQGAYERLVQVGGLLLGFGKPAPCPTQDRRKAGGGKAGVLSSSRLDLPPTQANR